MAVKKNFIDRFIERVEDVDANSRQAYILRLARERGFFETIANAIEEGILVVDTRLRIRYFNQAAKELLGLPDDLEKLRLPQLLRGVDWHAILSDDDEAWARISRQEIEIAYPVQRYIQFYLVPHNEEAKLATVILRDVTESRTRTIEAMEHQTSQTVAMLAAGVAHEIGNPLNSLYLNLQLLERSSGDHALSSEEAAAMIRDCKQEVERLDHLITSFLSAIRPGNPAFRMVDLRQLILETLAFMRQELSLRNITVVRDWPENLPPVSGDGTQLKQAFFNIIKNAMQAMPVGGKLEIAAHCDEEAVTLEFIDSGKGISASEISRIFAPFQSFKADGNGLGMMIIERVCREHGAEFAVNSRPDAGTAISIRFPRRNRRIRVLPEGGVDPAEA